MSTARLLLKAWVHKIHTDSMVHLYNKNHNTQHWQRKAVKPGGANGQTRKYFYDKNKILWIHKILASSL